VVALHLTTPDAEKIVTWLLEMGADLSLPCQDGDSIYTYARKNNLRVGTPSLNEVIYKSFCANPTSMLFSKLSGLRFTEEINGVRLQNGSLLDKLIFKGNFEALSSVKSILSIEMLNTPTQNSKLLVYTPTMSLQVYFLES
jgi:hypothetical protein